ncbi:DUF952 domain-containing protein [Sandarakinorhabdus sp. AAP62]|uniref:DUF952 domain-containing protein n=1 Tax=Sandarakinorhabdus sp. AAP62 TaxID=1248916 RepID=UPI00030C61A6|nr:DUF952 domain-containing protein [Sandarakinorhabdus sp. AAP62]
MTPIVKLLRAAEWAQFQATRVFAGSADDLRDGYIHISTPEQAPGTLAKWFAGEAGVVALTLDADALGPALKWEESRGGQLFPHLYRNLLLSDIMQISQIN